MTFILNRMTMEAYASFERLLGEKIVRVDDIHWRHVRPFFYRPLLQTAEYTPGSVRAPAGAWLGGVQHPVPPDAEANSFIHLILDKNAAAYSGASLDYNRQRQVRLAAKKFEMRSMTDVEEFKASAYGVYLSFYERTRYSYGSKRRDPKFFAKWADALFALRNLLILGAYRDGILHAVSVSVHVDDTLSFAMFFCDTDSLRLGVSDLMLHVVRQAAAQSSGVRQVYVGNFKNQIGLDGFYLLRGFSLVRKPALLQINPVSKMVMGWIMPRRLDQLIGMVQETPPVPSTHPAILPRPDPSERNESLFL